MWGEGEPKSIKLKITGHILRSSVNWQGALKQKGIKQRRIN
jgi:hypothetical protein